MQALKQEVFIPKHHKLEIKVPNDLPTGYADLFLIYKDTKIEKKERRKINLTTYSSKYLKKDFSREDSYNERF